METIEGVVEDIIFRNPDNGWTVMTIRPARPHPKADGEEITVVGKTMELHPGENVTAVGEWAVHKEYGQQFKAESIRAVLNSADDVKKYLTSGIVKGIGAETANRILRHFGSKAVEILDDNPQRFADIPGIKPTVAASLAESWLEARSERRVITFLQNAGFTLPVAQRIYETYGDDAIDQVKQDPYQLALDIQGVNFRKVDELAYNIGMQADSPERLIAGVVFALSQLCNNDGHVYAPRGLVVDKAAEVLGVERDLCEEAVTKALKRKQLIKKPRPLNTSGTAEALYLPEMYEKETQCAETLIEMALSRETRMPKAETIKWNSFFNKLSKNNNVKLTEQQQNAVHAALNFKVSVLTGGPGTGKTTTLRAVIEALRSIKAKVILASPTGRAAKRVQEATGEEARTIHRLLGYSIDGGFMYDGDNPLECDMVIIDETSMVDLDLFSRLLAAIPHGAHLLLVGDVDQLPSVGAGNVLHDVIESGVAQVTRLDAIFRQADDSRIVVNAHRVNHGEMPDLTNDNNDFFVFTANEPYEILELMVDVVTNRIWRKFGLDPLRDVQVLAPMYKGEVGIDALNAQLQAVLNPDGEQVQFAGKTFRVGDKVIQTRNNYLLDVYNGDIGRVIGAQGGTLLIDMDGTQVEYSPKDAADLLLAYAISIHRSQGGEYPAVVMPVATQHYRMLQRKLLYTAITRAKQVVVLVGQRRAVQVAVENDHVLPRYSGLGWLIADKLAKLDK
ncbi:MAG: ATP-dependent RecD-like DNA helicase [Anaerolineae bacterium]|nr:ATP-dependent RecD-like DNA helicase [Anaerolineae bacterium]